MRKLGMSQEAIAERVGVSSSTVSNWLAAGSYPETTRGPYVSRIDPYLPYLFQRWYNFDPSAYLERGAQSLREGDPQTEARWTDLVRLLWYGQQYE